MAYFPRSRLLSAALVCFGFLGATAQATKPQEVEWFTTPSVAKLGPVLSALGSAQKTIEMTIFHLTDPDVIAALKTAATRGVAVRVIMDRESLQDKHKASLRADLAAAHVQVKASTKGFDITHEKAFVVDAKFAWILSLNLTTKYSSTRDFGLKIDDAGAVAEIRAVFEADWKNADTGAAFTPPLTSRALVWSPVNAKTKLLGLIAGATKTLDTTVENLGDTDVLAALLDAANRRHVQIRVITPLCDLSFNPLFNVPALKQLAQNGIETRVMASPSTKVIPYMHQKTIIVDGSRAYVGSVNFSKHSFESSRELGIVFRDHGPLELLMSTFEDDWKTAEAVPPNPVCPHLAF